ncbi:MAG: GatB/YqeY domain-containing protein [Propionibacteriaceae bacterium]|jgi:uncharacterized protein YqeY|nr:GatB/YqeY domain-containing protein [Propionibacteriaceae bacterium]
MAELKDQIVADMKDAMRAKDQLTLGTLRMAKAAIMNEEVAGKAARELSQAEEQAVITREVRKRRESAEVYADAGRAELAEKETAEADILAKYIPAPLSEEEVDAIIAEEVAALPEPTIKAMGQVIKAVNARAGGQADGATVAAKVRAALA